MNTKIFLVLFLVLILATFVLANESIHCWRQEGFPTNSASIAFSGCVTAVSDGNYNYFGTPDSSVIATINGNYNFHCDDGDSRAKLVYAKMVVGGTGGTESFNSTSGTALSGSGRYCDSTDIIGYGNSSSISSSFSTSMLGGHEVNAYIANTPVAGTYGKDWVAAASNSIFIGTPSLLIFGPGNSTINFYDNKNETFDKNISFTLLNKSPLDNKIESYKIICAGDVTCTVDQTYQGWTVAKNNGELFIRGTITINKSNLPKNFNAYLDVNYIIPDLASPGCVSYYRNNVKSYPADFNAGLLDQQDFQVKIKSTSNQASCVGENGVLGQTGAAFAPRVNPVFGGGSDSAGKLIAIDECDKKTINGADNPGAVYCSQKEFISELARKIAEATKSSDASNASKYLTFDAYLRKQNLTNTNITNSITGIGGLLFSNIGIENDFGADKTTQVAKLNALFNAVSFTNATDLEAGLYSVQIDLTNAASFDFPADLFNGSTLNSHIQPKINLTQISVPPSGANWPFYDYGYTDNFDENISVYDSTPSSQSIRTTNINNRGTILELTEGDATSINIYKTYAVPLMIKLAGKTNGSADSNFVVTVTDSAHPNLFTYWTGFASSLGTGCETIASNATDTTLPYRLADKKMSVANDKTTFGFANLSSVAPSQVMYLETVLYLANNQYNWVNMSVPFSAYTAGNNYAGSATSMAPIDINSIITPFKISNTSYFESIVNGITDGNICVSKNINASGKFQWTVFWNEQKILQALASKKTQVVTDATICPTRVD